MTGGLLMFFLLYLVQAGLFFTIPLFLSVSLGLSALETGLRILPLSVTLLAAAVGIPRFFPNASPRRVVRFGLLAMFLGIVVLLAAIDADADARIVTVPLLLAGLGIGALASQLGAVTVSAVPDEDSPGGRRPAEHRHQPRCRARDRSGRFDPHRLPQRVVPAGRAGQPGDPASSCRPRPPSSSPSGVPFMSDAQLQTALTEAGVPPDVTAAAVDVNKEARVAGLRAALAVLAVIAMIGLFAARRIPREPVSGSPPTGDVPETAQQQ